ncbi:hypothetical protein [Ottowia testudinis]|uniref:Uncharacterized protein n=1 Tax=Ottowia testudinis TaxID=2816950 RepID=A0A975CJ91_9BURK|nr:hypothetical protein [Ottowia testudinis]QTD45194.1 hypothetical protein J1M35_19595 [Ottowia testudinis]
MSNDFVRRLVAKTAGREGREKDKNLLAYGVVGRAITNDVSRAEQEFFEFFRVFRAIFAPFA